MMKKEIADFRNQNGNVTYTSKELIQALHTKFDVFAKDNHDSHEQIRDRLALGDGRFGVIDGTIKARGTFLKIFTPILITLLGGMFYLILHLHGIIG